MLNEKLRAIDIEQLYALLGSGEFETCREAIRAKICDGCCSSGTVPFPGEAEFLLEKQRQGEIPSEVIIETHPFYKIRECVDTALGCKMGVFKPIACRIFPQINPLPNLGMISQEPSTQCPRQKFIGNNFEIKTAQAKLKLSPFLLPVKSIIEIASCVPRDKEDLNILVSALSPRATMLN